jgi:DNA-3-methyladenine glycosylase I
MAGLSNCIRSRCGWVDERKPYAIAYHDDEWGRSAHSDVVHFEFLSLEGAQAGLSWDIILRKRDGYRRAFAGFDPSACSELSDQYLDRVIAGLEGNVVKNKGKVVSVRTNAIAFMNIVEEHGSFDAWVWRFVNGKKIVGTFDSFKKIPTTTKESDELAAALKSRGFKFVGSTSIYVRSRFHTFYNISRECSW